MHANSISSNADCPAAAAASFDVRKLDVTSSATGSAETFSDGAVLNFKNAEGLQTEPDDSGIVSYAESIDEKNGASGLAFNDASSDEADHPDEAKSGDVDVDGVLPVPPDGGYGWVIVLAAFYCSFVVDGVATSFSPFIGEYRRKFNASLATVGLIGSSLIGAYLLVGPLASGLVNKYGARVVAILGGLLAGVAFFCSMWSTSAITMTLSYGVAGGAGLGLIYLPAMVIVCFYFEKKRSTAVGIAVSGSGVGTIVMPPLLDFLLKRFGCGWALTVMAGFALLCVIFGYLFKPLAPKPGSPQEPNVEKPPVEEMAPPAQGQRIYTERRFSGKRNRIVPLRKYTYPGCVANSTMPRRMRAASESDQHGELNKNRTSKSFSASTACRARISMRRYTRSLRRPKSMRANGATMFVEADFNHDLTEFARPMSRSDIFYQGSIKHLPEFLEEDQDYQKYRLSQVTVPAECVTQIVEPQCTNGNAEKDAPHTSDKSKCGCVPPSVKAIFAEMIDVGLLKEPTMLLLCLANVFTMLGFYIPFMFLVDMSIINGIKEADTRWMLSIIGVFNTLGRVAFGWIADLGFFTPLTLNNMSLIVSGILTFLCPLYVSYYTVMGFAMLYGFIVAAFISLTTIILTNLLGLDRLTNAFGIIVVTRGVASFLGTPLAGFLYDQTKSYYAPFWFAGILICCGGLAACLIPFFQRRKAAGQDSQAETGEQKVVDAAKLNNSATDSSLASTVANDEKAGGQVSSDHSASTRQI